MEQKMNDTPLFHIEKLEKMEKGHPPPVILLHGAFGSGENNGSFKNLITYFKRRLPEIDRHDKRQLIALHYFDHLKSSLVPLVDQVPIIRKKIQDVLKEIGGVEFILIGHSQGGVLGKAVLQTWENHKCIKFVTLASPHMGVFGLGWFSEVVKTEPDAKWHPFRELYEKLVKLEEKLLTKVIYNDDEGRFSIHDLWRDTFSFKNYLEKNTFMATYNNQYKDKIKKEYATNFQKVGQVIMFGGNGKSDLICVPNESAFFGFYKEGSTSVVEKMEEQDVFKEDALGWKTLGKKGKISRVREDAGHFAWCNDEKLFKLVYDAIFMNEYVEINQNNDLSFHGENMKKVKIGDENVRSLSFDFGDIEKLIEVTEVSSILKRRILKVYLEDKRVVKIIPKNKRLKKNVKKRFLEQLQTKSSVKKENVTINQEMEETEIPEKVRT